MASEKPPSSTTDLSSKAATKVEAPAVEKEEGTFTLEEMDALLAQEDPEFTRGLADIQSDDAKSELNIELLDIDEMIRQSEGRTLKARFKKLKLYLRSKISIIWVHTQMVLINLATNSAHWAKQSLIKAQEGVRLFKYIPWKRKLSIFAVLLFAGATFYYIEKAVTQGWIQEEPPLFIHSLEEWSTEKIVYNPEEQMEPFYGSSRLSQNLFSLKLFVVNVRRSETSGPNPMAAFEFYLEGTSTESIVEVKDRESEIRDHFQRTIEEMTYDQLVTTEGKQLLLEKLRREVNKLLTEGQIQKVYFKGAVIKP